MNHELSRLYPHQVDGVRFLAQRRRAILADDMGLGKTRQAIVAANEAAPEGTILVICPASLKLNWAREICLVEPGAEIEVIGVPARSSARPRWLIINYDLLGRYARQLEGVPWAGVIVDEAHFIKNASQRATRVLKLLGVSGQARAEPGEPRFVCLLTGTPMPNRPKDLFNLLRAVGHPSARSFLSFARQYCGAYRNDYGWVTNGASNLDELNLLMKEVMLRRKKDDVLDLPPKIRSWVPVQITGANVCNATQRFVEWYASTDPAQPNDTPFLADLARVRVALHKAKHAACAERVMDVLASGRKVLVFTCFSAGIARHKNALGDLAVTITGNDSVTARMAAVDAFQQDSKVRVALCNLLAGGVGLNLTAGTHVIFQDLDWVPANHLQAEDRCYRIGQREAVTVEYLLADGTLDGYIARLLEAKLALTSAVEANLPADESILRDLQATLLKLGPALMQEAMAARAGSADADRIEAIAAAVAALQPDTPLLEAGSWEFASASRADTIYRVSFGRAGHLECSCPGFEWRGDCKHVRQVRQQVRSD